MNRMKNLNHQMICRFQILQGRTAFLCIKTILQIL